MTLLLNNEEVEKALTPAGTIAATEQVYRELAEGAAFNRARSQVYLPVESKAHPGFRYRFKSQEGGSPGTELLAEEVQLPQARIDRQALIDRQDLIAEPLPSLDAEQGLQHDVAAQFDTRLEADVFRVQIVVPL